MLKARTTMPNDGHRQPSRTQETLAATTHAAYRFCHDFDILDARIGLSLHAWQPTPLWLEVRRWAPDDDGAPPRPMRGDGRAARDSRLVLTADLLELMRLCTVRLGGQAFDLGFGQAVLTIRNGGVRRIDISRQILLEDVGGLESFTAAVRCATGRENQKARRR